MKTIYDLAGQQNMLIDKLISIQSIDYELNKMFSLLKELKEAVEKDISLEEFYSKNLANKGIITNYKRIISLLEDLEKKIKSTKSELTTCEKFLENYKNYIYLKFNSLTNVAKFIEKIAETFFVEKIKFSPTIKGTSDPELKEISTKLQIPLSNGTLILGIPKILSLLNHLKTNSLLKRNFIFHLDDVSIKLMPSISFETKSVVENEYLLYIEANKAKLQKSLEISKSLGGEEIDL
jgi:hypothetical protein